MDVSREASTEEHGAEVSIPAGARWRQCDPVLIRLDLFDDADLHGYSDGEVTR
jgi:hypothetical protein